MISQLTQVIFNREDERKERLKRCDEKADNYRTSAFELAEAANAVIDNNDYWPDFETVGEYMKYICSRADIDTKQMYRYMDIRRSTPSISTVDLDEMGVEKSYLMAGISNPDDESKEKAKSDITSDELQEYLERKYHVKVNRNVSVALVCSSLDDKKLFKEKFGPATGLITYLITHPEEEIKYLEWLANENLHS